VTEAVNSRRRSHLTIQRQRLLVGHLPLRRSHSIQPPTLPGASDFTSGSYALCAPGSLHLHCADHLQGEALLNFFGLADELWLFPDIELVRSPLDPAPKPLNSQASKALRTPRTLQLSARVVNQGHGDRESQPRSGLDFE
jgi:hypothetical protein